MSENGTDQAAYDKFLRIYVLPYYSKLLHANFLRRNGEGDEDFPAFLTLAATSISNAQLTRLFNDENWRTRLTAAWFAGVTRRTSFVTKIARCLAENRGAYDEQGLCFALGLIGGPTAKKALIRYLEAHLPRRSHGGHEEWAVGALAYLEGEAPSRFTDPALWRSPEEGNSPTKAIESFVEIVRYLSSNGVIEPPNSS